MDVWILSEGICVSQMCILVCPSTIKMMKINGLDTQEIGMTVSKTMKISICHHFHCESGEPLTPRGCQITLHVPPLNGRATASAPRASCATACKHMVV